MSTARTRLPMPNDQQIMIAQMLLTGNLSRHDNTPETAEACNLVCKWMEQEIIRRRDRLEQRFTGGRPR